jgi:hypothetical protein
MTTNGKPSMAERLRDRKGIDQAIRAGVQQAMRVHKLLGHSIAVGRPDGSVVIVPPEEIQLDDDKNGPPKLPDSMIP